MEKKYILFLKKISNNKKLKIEIEARSLFDLFEKIEKFKKKLNIFNDEILEIREVA